MPKYLFKGSYSAEGAAGVLAEGGSAREAVAAKAAESLGGSLESFYFAFGATDIFVTADMPDNSSAASLALQISSAGKVALETVVLLTPAEIDAARDKKADYRPPGG